MVDNYVKRDNQEHDNSDTEVYTKLSNDLKKQQEELTILLQELLID